MGPMPFIVVLFLGLIYLAIGLTFLVKEKSTFKTVAILILCLGIAFIGTGLYLQHKNDYASPYYFGD